MRAGIDGDGGRFVLATSWSTLPKLQAQEAEQEDLNMILPISSDAIRQSVCESLHRDFVRSFLVFLGGDLRTKGGVAGGLFGLTYV